MFSNTDVLFLEIYPLKVFSNIVWIRISTLRGAPTCHLYHGYALLIQFSDCQRGRSAVSRNISTEKFLEIRTYLHPLPVHVLQIRGLNFQKDKLTCYQGIRTQNFFDIQQYPVNRSTWGPVVATLTRSCSPDTNFWMFSHTDLLFLKLNPLKVFSNIVWIRISTRRGSRRANSYIVMFSWYKFPIYSYTDLLFLEINPLKIFRNSSVSG